MRFYDARNFEIGQVARVSRLKALAVSRGEENIVIAADTIVVCQGKVLGKPHSEKEILKYVQSGEPMDKAGAYGIQGGAALFCEKLEGDYYNVMGLPVCRLYETLCRTVPEVMEDTI